MALKQSPDSAGVKIKKAPWNRLWTWAQAHPLWALIAVAAVIGLIIIFASH